MKHTALANAGKDRSISKRIGSIPEELWFREDFRFGFSVQANQFVTPAGYDYSVSQSGGAADFSSIAIGGAALFAGTLRLPAQTYCAIRDGEALPATATIALGFTKSSDVISLHGLTYDISALEDGQAYRLVSIPNSSDVPASAIAVNRDTN